MPTNESSLKQKNIAYLWSCFGFNMIIFLWLFFATHIENTLGSFKAMLTLRSFSICIAPLLLFIVNGLLSPNQKAILVFWRLKNILPGNRAFSYHAHKDDRIDVTKLSLMYPNLPTIPKEQNRLWYKIYKSNSDEIAIKKSHKDFLLARDLASMSFLFFAFVGIPCLLFLSQSTKWYYFIFLAVQYLIMVVLAQNHGRRFVRNVLAIESVK